MSYIAFATDAFEEVTRFYGETLGFEIVDAWDRANGRGRRFQLGGGLRLEILDNRRERTPVLLDRSERVHVVVEVDDIEVAWRTLPLEAPSPTRTSWGASLFRIEDPDGVPVTFLQWLSPAAVGQ